MFIYPLLDNLPTFFITSIHKLRTSYSYSCYDKIMNKLEKFFSVKRGLSEIQINPDTRNLENSTRFSPSIRASRLSEKQLFLDSLCRLKRAECSLASSSVKREDKCVGEHDTPALSRIKIRNAGQTVRRRPRGRVGGLVSNRTHADFITWATDNGKKSCCIIVGPRPGYF